MAEYPPGLARRPADEAARLIALTQLDAARAARRRLADPDDAEALHDLRVGLRRLRTTIRSFRGQLDRAVSRKLRRRVRDLARTTGAARDAEVQLAWIAARRHELPRGGRAGLPWLIARLSGRRDTAYVAVRRAAPAEFDRIDARLRKSLAGLAKSATPGPAAPPFGSLVAELVQERAAELARRLSVVRSTADEADAHAARIQAKRLRYVLEPLTAEAPRAADAVSRLKQLQDLLGELNDVHGLITELGDAVADAAAERARGLHKLALRREAQVRPTPGRRRPRPASAALLALARLAAEAQERLLRRVVTEWRDGRGGGALADLLEAVAAVGDRLAGIPALPPQPRSLRGGLPRHRPAKPSPLPSRHTAALRDARRRAADSYIE